MKTSKIKRFLAAVLAAAMVFTSVPTEAFAAETADSAEQVMDTESSDLSADEQIQSSVEATVDEADLSGETVLDESVEQSDEAAPAESIDSIAEEVIEEATTASASESIDSSDIEVGNGTLNIGELSCVSAGYKGYILGNVNYEAADDSPANIGYKIIQYDENRNQISKGKVTWWYATSGKSWDSGRTIYWLKNAKYASVIFTDYNSEYENYYSKVYFESELFERTGIPQVQYKVTSLSASTSKASINLSAEGDFSFVNDGSNYISCTDMNCFIRVKKSDTEEWSSNINATGYLNFDSYNTTTKSNINISYYGSSNKLEPNTSYDYKVYISSYNPYGSDYTLDDVSETVLTGQFTTAENKTYNVKEAFPDEAFREVVLSRANKSSDVEEITSADLENITTLYTSDNTGIKNIKGVELLVNLSSLSVTYSSLEDVSNVDFSALKMLTTLKLSNNKLTKIPDLRKCQSIRTLYISGNSIPDEEFELHGDYISHISTVYDNNQQTEGTGKVVLKDFGAIFGGFDVKFTGKASYTSHSTNALDTIYIYVDQYDANNKLISKSGRDDWYTSYEYNLNNYNFNDSYILPNTAYVGISMYADELESDTYLTVKPVFTSEPIARAVSTDITCSAKTSGISSSSITVDAAVKGDFGLASDISDDSDSNITNTELTVIAYYKKSGTNDWKLSNSTSSVYIYRSSNSHSTDITIDKLDPNTSYDVKIQYCVYNDADYGIPLGEEYTPIGTYEFSESIKTKELKYYNLNTVIQDEVLRSAILKKLQNYIYDDTVIDQTNVSSDDLGKITYFEIESQDVKSLKGMEILDNLTYIAMYDTDISDISDVKWGSFEYLYQVSLRDCEITSIPDFRGCTALRYLNLIGNKISDDEILKASEYIAHIEDVYLDSQRLNGISARLEKCYYKTNGKVPFYAQATGIKASNKVESFTFYIDDKELTNNEAGSYYKSTYVSTDTGLEVGDHTFYYTYVKNGETYTSSKMKILVEETSGAVVTDGKYMYTTDSSVYFSFLMAGFDKKPAEAYMVRTENGKEVLYGVVNEDDFYTYVSSYDNRYEYLNSYTSYSNLHVGFSIRNRYYNAPTGPYDIRIVWEDKTETVIEKAITCLDNSVHYLDEVSTDSNYDNRSGYIYLSMYSHNVDPTKLTYTLTKDGRDIKPITYVEHNYTYNGFIVKLELNEGTIPSSGNYFIKVQGSENYKLAPSESVAAHVYFNNGIYFHGYNAVRNIVEAAYTTGFFEEGETQTTADIYQGYSYNYENLGVRVASAVGEIVNGMIYYSFFDLDGNEWIPTNGQEYTFVNEEKNIWFTENIWYYQTDSQNGGGSGTPTVYRYYNWDSTNSKITEGDNSFSITCKTNATASELTGINAFVEGNDDIALKTAVTTSGNYRQITVTGNLSALSAGQYAIVLFNKDNNLISRTSLHVLAKEFVLNRMSVDWETKGSIARIYLETLYTRDSDEYVVTIYDMDGNEIKGLTVKKDDSYSSGLYLEVSGFNKASAERNYYVLVKHKTFELPVKSAGGQRYYSSEYGQYISFYDHTVSYYIQGNSVYALHINKELLPVTVSISLPTSITPIETFKVTASDLENDNYYFTKAQTDKLPDKDALYRIIVSDADGYISGDTTTITCRQTEVSNGFSASLTKGDLIINGTDEEKKATINVSMTGTAAYLKKTPVFSSADSLVASVAASKDDPRVGIVTATGVGETVISVNVDGEIKRFNVYVRRVQKVDSIAFYQDQVTMYMDAMEPSLWVNSVPFNVGINSADLTFESSDTEVLDVEKREDNGCDLILKKPGQATVTAKLKDTELTATCQVTVKGVYTDEEMQSIYQPLDNMRYVLVPKTTGVALSTIELPEGFEWTKPDQVVKAKDTTPVQYFEATYKREYYPDLTYFVPVAVSSIKSVAITGPAYVENNTEAEFALKITYTGYQLEPYDVATNDITCTWNITTAKQLTETDSDNRSISVAAALAEGATANLAQNISAEVKFGTEKYAPKFKTTILAKPLVDQIYIHDESAEPADENKIVRHNGSEDGSVITIDWEDVSKARGAVKDQIVLSAEALIDGTVVENASLTWSSSDTAVASISTNAKGPKTITIKKAGNAQITVTSKDQGKASRSVVIAVQDFKPSIALTKVNANIYSTAGIDLGFVAKYGYEIQRVSVDKNVFEISKDETSGAYLFNLTSEKPADYNGIKSCTLEVTVKKGEDERTYTYPLGFALTKTAPAMTVKQTKAPNLFYKNTTATFKVTGKAAVIGVVDPAAESQNPGFYVSDFDAETGTITVSARGLDSNTVSSFIKNYGKHKVTLKLDGYKDQEVTLTISGKSTPEAYSLKDVIILRARNQDGAIKSEAPSALYNTKTKTYVDDLTDYSFEVTNNKTNTAAGVTVSVKDDKVYVYASNKGTYSINVSNDNWTSTVPAKFGLSFAAQQTIQLSQSSVTLNTASNFVKGIDISYKGNEDPIKYIQISGQNKASADVLSAGFICITSDAESGEIYLGIGSTTGDNAKYVKNAAYKFKVITRDEYDFETKPVTLTVNVTKNAPGATLTAKGSINLYDRSNTSITYTTKLSNLESRLNWVELEGEDANLFYIDQAGDNSFTVKANYNPMTASKTYKLTAVLHCEGNITIRKAVSIKPVAKQPKIILTMKNNVWVTGSETGGNFDVDFAASNGEYLGQISTATDKVSSKFFMVLDEDVDTEYVQWKLCYDTDNGPLKPGKYTVTINVDVDGAPYDAKPIPVKTTIIVK